MRPKGKMIALLAIFVAIGLVTATGAFTSVQAERTVNIAVAGDSAALLGLAPNATSANGAYAEEVNNQLAINISTSNANQGSTGDFEGEGVNDNAQTNISHVFNISNHGTQDVVVDLSGEPAGFDFYIGSDPSQKFSTASVGVRTVSPGNHLSIGVYVDTRSGGFTGGTYTVTIEANAA